jgi:hypothetical protein
VTAGARCVGTSFRVAAMPFDDQYFDAVQMRLLRGEG